MGELIRLAGMRMASVVLIGADKSDESLGVTRTLDELARSGQSRVCWGRPDGLRLRPVQGIRFRTSRCAADERGRPFRVRRRAFAAAVPLLVAFGFVTARLFVSPTQGMPARVGAIVMLAGPGDRLPVALQLARQHRAAVLVVSQGQHGYGGPCPSATPGVKLVCFEPDPGDTRGERPSSSVGSQNGTAGARWFS